MFLPYAEFDKLARKHLKDLKDAGRVVSSAEVARVLGVPVKGYRAVINADAAEQARIGLTPEHLQGWLSMWNAGGVQGGTRLPAPPPGLIIVERGGVMYVEVVEALTKPAKKPAKGKKGVAKMSEDARSFTKEQEKV